MSRSEKRKREPSPESGVALKRRPQPMLCPVSNAKTKAPPLKTPSLPMGFTMPSPPSITHKHQAAIPESTFFKPAPSQLLHRKGKKKFARRKNPPMPLQSRRRRSCRVRHQDPITITDCKGPSHSCRRRHLKPSLPVSSSSRVVPSSISPAAMEASPCTAPPHALAVVPLLLPSRFPCRHRLHLGVAHQPLALSHSKLLQSKRNRRRNTER